MTNCSLLKTNNCIVRTIIKSNCISVQVTQNVMAIRQDASLWRDKVLELLRDPKTAHERAMQLKIALRRDELTKESHDDFISYILGSVFFL